VQLLHAFTFSAKAYPFVEYVRQRAESNLMKAVGTSSSRRLIQYWKDDHFQSPRTSFLV
jgi:hypothetical protein